jgi:hypothetical protein
MKYEFWNAPFTLSLAVTPIVLAAAILPAGAGHGSYTPAKFLFPYCMLIAHFSSYITGPACIAALLQFPAYGTALGIADQHGRFREIGIILLLMHIALVLVLFLNPDPTWS